MLTARLGFAVAAAAAAAAVRHRRLCARASAALLSYNVLADGPKYAMKDKFAYCPEEARAWPARWPRLLRVLLDADADVLCVQEAQRLTFDRDMQPALAAAGYWGFLAERNPGSQDQTDALFVRRAAFSVASVRVARYRDEAAAHVRAGGVREAVQERGDLAIVARLRHRASGRPLAVVSTHLHWHPSDPHVKMLQAWLAARIVAAEEREWGPVALAGDFNSLPLKTEPDEFDPQLPPGGLVSGAYQLLTGGAVGAEHPDHPLPRAGLPFPALAPPVRLRSANVEARGREPLATTLTETFTGTLDYVFVTEGIRVSESVRVPRLTAPVPDVDRHPSDHMPVGCSFTF